MNIWLYGQPFSGKTYLASKFPNNYIISTDGNAEYLFPEDHIFRVKSYNDLSKTFDSLKKIPNDKMKYLTIDVTSYLLDLVREHWLEEQRKNSPGITHESDLPYKGYRMLRDTQWETILSLARLCDNIIFISHENIWVEKNKFGREINRFDPVFEDKLKTQMSGLMTFICRTVKEKDTDGNYHYNLNIGDIQEELGGNRLPLKSTKIIDVDYEKFMANIIKPGEKE